MNRHLRLSGWIIAFCCICFLPLKLTCQEELSREISAKIFNAQLLGLDSTASVGGGEYSGPGAALFSVATSSGYTIRMQLRAETAFVDSEYELKHFISKNGIFPDANVISLIYDLNPDLASIPKINTRTRIQVPILRVLTAKSQPESPVIRLVMDGKLKAELCTRVDDFRKVWKKTKHLSSAIKANFVSINYSFGHICNDDVPASHEMLRQADAEADKLLTMLSEHRGFGTEFATDVGLIKSDLTEKIGASQEGNPDVRVVVRTIVGTVEKSHYIVCYAPEALYRPGICDFQFPHESSPTDQVLAEASYLFWAINTDSSKAAVSQVRPIHVRRQSPDSLEVSLNIPDN